MMPTGRIWKKNGRMMNSCEYEQYEAFDDLEEAYLDMEEQVTTLVASYVDNHLELFAKIIK